MARPRIPAWFYLVAESFLVLFAVLAYSTVYPPAPIGLFFDLRNGELFVKRVVPGMPAERAGLRPGDRVLLMDGWPMNSQTARMTRVLTVAVDVPQPVVLEREGRRVELQIVSHGRERVNLLEHRVEISELCVQLFSILLGLSVMARRPHDRVALLGGWLLASLGAQPLTLPRGALALSSRRTLPGCGRVGGGIRVGTALLVTIDRLDRNTETSRATESPRRTPNIPDVGCLCCPHRIGSMRLAVTISQQDAFAARSKQVRAPPLRNSILAYENATRSNTASVPKLAITTSVRM